MHLCLTLQSKLNELKVIAKALSELADRVLDVESFDDLKKMKEIVHKRFKYLEENIIKLNDLKLNFKQELLEYLGINDEDIDCMIDREGYILTFNRPGLSSKFEKVKKVNPDLCGLIRLDVFDLSWTNLVCPYLPTENLTEIIVRGCPDLPETYDLSHYAQLELADFRSSSVKKILINDYQYNKLTIWPSELKKISNVMIKRM